MNLLGIMPAKEGGKQVKRQKVKGKTGINFRFGTFLLFIFDFLLIEHSFAGVLFIFGKRMILR